MHRFAFAVAAALLVIGLSCDTVRATGNVLVPSGDSSAPDDLGLSAQKPESDKPDTSSQSDTSAPEESSALPALDNGAPEGTSPGNSMSITGDTITQKMVEQKMPDAPQIMQMPATPAQSTPEDANLPNSLEIDIAGSKDWTPVDKSTVYNTLGIGPDAVAKHCHLSGAGMATSASAPGIYTFDTGTGHAAILRYDGKLTDMTVRLQALCDPVPLPASARYVMKVGDNYSVFLTQITCDKPPAKAQRLTVQYMGSGSGKCVYE